MAVNLSIKNVPEKVVKRLRQHASRHHRSLQGELMAIIEASAFSDERLTTVEVYKKVKQSGLLTPSEATEMIRTDRDGR